MGTLGASAKAHIKAGLHSQLLNDLGATSQNDEFVPDTLFNSSVTEFLEVFIMYVVMADDGAGEDRLCIRLYGRIHQFFHGHRGAKIDAFNAIFLDAAMLDVNDFPKPYRMLIVAQGSSHNLHRIRFNVLTDLLIT